MFLGFPVYFILDTAFKNHKKAHIDKDGHNTTRLRATPRAIFSIIMQVIPFALFMLWLSKTMITGGVHKAGVFFTLLALMFGNTSSIFMNTYFGHGMAGAFAIALLHFLYKKNYRMVGLFYGMTLLSEYAAAVIFFPLIIGILMQKKAQKSGLKSLLLVVLFLDSSGVGIIFHPLEALSRRLFSMRIPYFLKVLNMESFFLVCFLCLTLQSFSKSFLVLQEDYFLPNLGYFFLLFFFPISIFLTRI